MKITETSLNGCFVLQPMVYEDNRGYFIEMFNEQKFNESLGLNINFVQDNESFSTKGVLRGLHFQSGVYAQAKLVRVTHGEVLDVVVDLRKESPTFGMHHSVILSDKNKKQLFIPRGFAHGFVVKSNTAIFSYKCDNYYNKNSESGILFNDPQLNIDWGLSEKELTISQKDLNLPNFNAVSL